jgi:hypothetical protein
MNGVLKWNLRVERDGKVSAVEKVTDTLSEPEVARCAENVLRRPFQEVPRGGCALFILPLEVDIQATGGDE